MGILDRAKLIADIGEVSSRIYGMIIDKSRDIRDRDEKIAKLEKQIEELKEKTK